VNLLNDTEYAFRLISVDIGSGSPFSKIACSLISVPSFIGFLIKLQSKVDPTPTAKPTANVIGRVFAEFMQETPVSNFCKKDCRMNQNQYKTEILSVLNGNPRI
jgi:hypothetical protein